MTKQTRRTASIESLESRRLLSTITWTNRGLPSDRIDSTFGANAAAARAVIDSALHWWERVITNFNYSDGSNMFKEFIEVLPTGTGFGANSDLTGHIGGKPSTGAVHLGRGADTTGDGNGDGAGYFLDPTPDDYFEFQDPPRNGPPNNRGPYEDHAFSAHTASISGSDLWSTVLHEIGHTLGLGPELTVAPHVLVTNTHIPDAVELGTTLWTFNGPDVVSLWTSSNAGAENFAPTHVAIPQQNVGSAYAAIELMISASGGGERRMVSNVDGLILKDAYDYSIVMPEQIGNFQTNLNSVTHQLVLRGGNFVSDDMFSISSSGGFLNVSVDVGNDAPGTGPTDAFQMSYPLADVTSVVVNAGEGDDAINIDNLPTGIPVTVLGQSGKDTLTLADKTHDLDNIKSPITVNLGTQTDSLVLLDQNSPFSNSYQITNTAIARATFGGVVMGNTEENITIAPDAQADTVDVKSLFASQHLTVAGSANNDTVFLGFAAQSVSAIAGTVFVSGASNDGFDSILIYDQSYGGTDTWNYSDNLVERFGFGGVSYSLGVEDIALSAGTAGAAINVFSTLIGTTNTINAGAGDDTITISPTASDVTPNFGGVLILDGQTDSGFDPRDRLIVNDFMTSFDADWTINESTIDKSNAFPASALITYSNIETVLLFGGSGATMYNIAMNSGSTAVSVYTGAESDLVSVTASTFTPVTVDGQSGFDTVDVNMDNFGLAIVRFASTQMLKALRIGQGGNAFIEAGGNRVLLVQSLFMATTGFPAVLDLRDNDFIFDYFGGGGSPIATIQSLITTGFNSGNWSGVGISSSVASSVAGNPSLTHKTALGYAEASEIGNPATFSGIPIDSSAVLVKYTWYGDANLSGSVDSLDFNALAAHFGTSGNSWVRGNFNFDAAGFVDSLDFNAIASNFGQTGL